MQIRKKNYYYYYSPVKIEATMKNDQINSMINSLEYAVIKARWYRDSGDISYLKECGDWIEVSRLYMRHINPNTNNDIDNLLGSLEIQ